MSSLALLKRALSPLEGARSRPAAVPCSHWTCPLVQFIYCSALSDLCTLTSELPAIAELQIARCNSILHRPLAWWCHRRLRHRFTSPNFLSVLRKSFTHFTVISALTSRWRHHAHCFLHFILVLFMFYHHIVGSSPSDCIMFRVLPMSAASPPFASSFPPLDAGVTAQTSRAIQFLNPLAPRCDSRCALSIFFALNVGLEQVIV